MDGEQLTNPYSENNQIPVEKNPNYVSGITSLILALIKYILLSIVIVHVFGFFGVFIALSYPLLWFFFPQKTICFFCLHKILQKKSTYCHVCHREVRTIYDPPFRSMIINMFLLLIISILLFVLVFAEVTLLSNGRIALPAFLRLERGTTSIELPVVEKYVVGQKYYFDIELNEVSTPINATRIDLKYNSDLIEVTEINTDHSFATIFAQKEYSNKNGRLQIVGGLPSPGYLSDDGNVARVYFVTKGVGLVTLEFQNSSKVLANDGDGTPLNYTFEQISFLVEQ